MQLLHLLLGDFDLLERRGDLVERQESPLLAIRDQPAELIELIDRRAVR